MCVGVSRREAGERSGGLRPFNAGYRMERGVRQCATGRSPSRFGTAPPAAGFPVRPRATLGTTPGWAPRGRRVAGPWHAPSCWTGKESAAPIGRTALSPPDGSSRRTSPAGLEPATPGLGNQGSQFSPVSCWYYVCSPLWHFGGLVVPNVSPVFPCSFTCGNKPEKCASVGLHRGFQGPDSCAGCDPNRRIILAMPPPRCARMRLPIPRREGRIPLPFNACRDRPDPHLPRSSVVPSPCSVSDAS